MPRASYLRRIRRFPRWKLRLLPESIFWLLVARLSLVFVPFPRIGRYLGRLQPPAPLEPMVDEATALVVYRIGRTVDTVADHSPLELVCLPRALAGWQMLHRRGIASRLHFGALREPNPERPGLNTHAWLTSSGVEVTGYPVAHGCVELGYFARVVAGVAAGPTHDDGAVMNGAPGSGAAAEPTHDGGAVMNVAPGSGAAAEPTHDGGAVMNVAPGASPISAKLEPHA